MKLKHLKFALVAALIAGLFVSCNPPDTPTEITEETYAGGKLGTTFNSSSTAYEDPTPATENAGLATKFKYGEYFFERTYTQNTEPFDGLGPLYIRSSCIACHPGYGHGMRMNRYRADDWGNGYLLLSKLLLMKHR